MDRHREGAWHSGTGWTAPNAYLVAEDDSRDIDDLAIAFGELLSCLRLAAHLSQNALGHAAGVDASYINRLESGKRRAPSREVALALARALDATPTEQDRLLWKAGYAPASLMDLNPADPTMVAVARVLANRDLSPLSRAQFRVIVETLAWRWHGRLAVPSAGNPDEPGRSLRSWCRQREQHANRRSHADWRP
mgnify:CR=1 FL=1